MTRDQLDESFTKYYDELVRAARRRYKVPDDAADVVNSVYVKAVSGQEYKNVRTDRIRRWWHYKVRGWIDAQKMRDGRTKHAEVQFHESCGDCVDMELTEKAGKDLVEGEWRAMTRLQRSRLRAKYKEEGIPLLPFMYPYRKGV